MRNTRKFGCWFILVCVISTPYSANGQNSDTVSERVVVNNLNWELIGDFQQPVTDSLVPAVLLLNQAAGDRRPYEDLAASLAANGIASLRLDLRGHGESVNLGHFIPGENTRDPLIWDAEIDVVAAYEYLKSRSDVDSQRIAIVGSSYSGEEMAEAGRLNDFAKAYVALSPGSFSDESIANIDSSGVDWLFVIGKRDPFLESIAIKLQSQSDSAELLIISGSIHATDILDARPDISDRIALWLAQRLF